MKIKGPFGEIQVIDGKLGKGESPCKSCEHQFTCQFEERCGAKFDGWESVSDNPKPENPAFVKCKDCGNVLDRGLCLNCNMRKLQPPSGAIVPERTKGEIIMNRSFSPHVSDHHKKIIDKKGRVRITKALIESLGPEAILVIFGQMVIIRAEFQFCDDCFHYIALHPEFREIGIAEVVPAYTLIATHHADDDGNIIEVTVEWKERNSHIDQMCNAPHPMLITTVREES